MCNDSVVLYCIVVWYHLFDGVGGWSMVWFGGRSCLCTSLTVKRSGIHRATMLCMKTHGLNFSSFSVLALATLT